MPTLDEALQMAMAQHRAGRLDVAEEMYRQITQQAPQHPDAWHLLGVVAHQLGNHARALELIDHAIAMYPQVASYHSNRGEALRGLGRLVEAEAALRRAIELDPQFADAWNNLGLVLQSQGRPRETIEAFNHALAAQPGYAEVLNNRGLMLQKTGRMAEALADFQEALRQKPTYPQAYNNLGGLFHEHGQYTQARAAYEHAVRLLPTYGEALNNLGLLLLAQGRHAEAAARFRESLRVKPDNPGGFSNLLLCEQYCPNVTLAGLAELHEQWDRQFGIPLRAAWRPHANLPDPHRLLRLGFVSADLYRHPVAALIQRVFERLDRRQFQVFVYSNRLAEDEVSGKLRQSVDVWREIVGRTDDDVAEIIRRDEIDVLFDLSGHTSGNKLLVFARKPAPIQISWLGYVGTTGLSAMDYLFTDEAMVPPEFDRFYRETVIRLPLGPACYSFPDELPPVAPPPMLSRGYITYGSFNNQAKVTGPVIAAWAEILRRVPESRLLLKFRGLDDPETQAHFSQAFAAAGIVPERLQLRGPSSLQDMLSEYADVDVALDPFPYNGGTTSLLTLVMGVPVVTCPGQTVASRQTLSVLRTIGMVETVAETLDNYIALAERLASDPDRLQAWRGQLRERMLKSPFVDIDAWMPSIVQTIRELWRQWCERHTAQ